MTLVTRKIRRIAKAQDGLSIQNPNPYLDGGLAPMKISKPQPIKSNLLQKIGIKTKAGISAGAGAVGNFVKNNPDLVKTGINIIGENFGKDVKLGGNAAAFQDVSKIVSQMPGMAGVIGTAVNVGMNVAGDVFGSKVSYTPNQEIVEATNTLGGSYGGTVNNINNAANNNYTYFLNRTGRKKAKQLRKQAINQGKQLANIHENTLDQQAMVSDINSLAYHNKLLGSYDARTIIKQGGVINKINNIKSKNLFKIKKIKPIEINNVDEFKLGGVIDINNNYNDWEPVDIVEFQDGGKITEIEEVSEVITQQNVIPEGALHKNKHHMEHAENLTKKGIPVIDNDGEQQAEIEKDEWVMSLELTKIIEDLYHQYYGGDLTNKEKDELATKAGKIITDQLLNNTDDRTGLLEKIE